MEKQRRTEWKCWTERERGVSEPRASWSRGIWQTPTSVMFPRKQQSNTEQKLFLPGRVDVSGWRPYNQQTDKTRWLLKFIFKNLLFYVTIIRLKIWTAGTVGAIKTSLADLWVRAFLFQGRLEKLWTAFLWLRLWDVLQEGAGWLGGGVTWETPVLPATCYQAVDIVNNRWLFHLYLFLHHCLAFTVSMHLW